MPCPAIVGTTPWMIKTNGGGNGALTFGQEQQVIGQELSSSYLPPFDQRFYYWRAAFDMTYSNLVLQCWCVWRCVREYCLSLPLDTLGYPVHVVQQSHATSCACRPLLLFGPSVLAAIVQSACKDVKSGNLTLSIVLKLSCWSQYVGFNVPVRSLLSIFVRAYCE